MSAGPLLLVMLGSLVGAAQAEEGEQSVLIWQGFRQSWGYNHRVARLGDWVSGGEVHHAAATGTGPDRAEFESLHLRWQADDLWWQNTVVELDLSGLEGEAVRSHITLEVPANPGAPEDTEVLALLSGFDLAATGSADKVQAFRVSLGEAGHDPVSGQLQVALEAGLTADCNSPECPREDGVDYRLRVHVLWLWVRGSWVSQRVEHATRWSRWQEPEATRVTGLLQANPGVVGANILAWREISFAMDRPAHLLRFHTVLHPGAYDPSTGVQAYEIEWGFLPWQRGMKAAHLPYSLLAYRSGGEARWSGEVVLLQSGPGRVEPARVSGLLKWPGRNLPASDPAALWQGPSPRRDEP